MATACSSFDWAVIGLYVIALVIVSVYASGRQHSSFGYFIGDRTLPWWAVGLSLAATETGAIFYVGLSGLAFRRDWYFVQALLGYLVARVVVAFFFLRVFYRFELTTVYGFLGTRFGSSTRVLAALAFLLVRAASCGVCLFVAALLLSLATGIGPLPATLGLMVGALALTLYGGNRAVVWTDGLLLLTFLVCGTVGLGFLLREIDGGLIGALAQLTESGKGRVFHTGAPGGTTWAAFFASDQPFLLGALGGLFLGMATCGTDQTLVQRGLGCSTSHDARRAVLASAALLLPPLLLLAAAGSLTWVLFDTVPERLVPLAQGVRQGREDYYFPLFLVRVLPAGLVGIVLVGVLAPAISALTSSLNSLAATTVEDIYRPFLAREREESHYLRAGRAATLVWAALLTLAAWFLLRGRGIAFSATLALHTCLYGAVLGVFLLGILTRRGNALSTSFGMLAAAATVILLQWRVALDARGRIPEAAAALIERLPVTWNRWVAEHVPLLGWPLWIVAGALVSFVLGFLGSQVIARRGR